MKKFDEQLLRLKQIVKLTEDQDVAVLLGLSKAAFSDRKKRDAFPVDKLWALATRRPELRIDPMYVLMGDAKEAAVNLTIAQLEAALALTADQGGTLAEQFKRAGQIVEEMHRPMPADEQALLAAYRRCAVPARQTLIQAAELLAGPVAPIVAARAKSAKKSGRPSPMSIVVEASTAKKKAAGDPPSFNQEQ